MFFTSIKRKHSLNKFITLFWFYFQSKVNDLKFGFWKETSNEKSAFNETSSIKCDWVQVFRLWNKSSSAFVSTTQWMNFGDPSSDGMSFVCGKYLWTNLILRNHSKVFQFILLTYLLTYLLNFITYIQILGIAKLEAEVALVPRNFCI